MKRFVIVLILLLCASAVYAGGALTLDCCRDMALEHSRTLRQEYNKEKNAVYDLQIARLQRLPMFDGSLMGVYMKDQELMEGTTIQMRGMYAAGINVTLPVYAGGRISAGIKLAGIAKDAAALQIRKAKDAVVAEVDNCYYTLLAVREKVKMLEAYSRQMEGLYDMVELSVRAELSTENDLLRIDARRTEIEYQKQKVRNGENLCRMALCKAVGLPPDTDIELADTLLVVAPPQDLSEDFSQRPELGLLSQQVAASEAQVKMARSAYLPTIALAGGYSYYGNIKMKGSTMLPDGTPYQYTNKFRDGIPLVALSVNIPIWHWGSEIKKVKKSKLDLENSRLALEENTELMSMEVCQAVQNLTDGYAMIRTAELGLRQAEDSRRIMRCKFDVGFATLTDMLDAEAQWSQARANLIEAQAQQLINNTEYLRMTGRLRYSAR